MNSTLAHVVRECAAKSIGSSQAEVERFRAGYTKRIATLRNRIKTAGSLLITMAPRVRSATGPGHFAERAAASVRQIEASISSVEGTIKDQVSKCTDRLSKLPDLMELSFRNLRGNAPAQITQDVVCPKVEITIRPYLASISNELNNTKVYADHQLHEVEQNIAKMEDLVRHPIIQN
jgi:hypothetical protein